MNVIGNSTYIALSGMHAASKRLANSANNVANMHTTTSRIDGERVNQPFRPQQVTQTSLASGGVVTNLRGVEPASVSVPDASNVAADAEGITQYPNVDLEEEIVTQQIASYDFKANAKVISTENSMFEALLNMTA